MNDIFVSYRRKDSASICGRIYDRLVARYGKERIFMDIDSIQPGVDFADYINERLSRCAVQLVIIGPLWLNIKDNHKQRRLDDPSDLVRFEVEEALRRKMRVIPLLVEGVSMPSVDQLPVRMKPLAFLNGLNLDNGVRFDADMARLIATLDDVVGQNDNLNGPDSAASSHTYDSTRERPPITDATYATASKLLREWHPNLQTIHYVNIRRLMQDDTAMDLLADLLDTDVGRLNSLREVAPVGPIIVRFKQFLKQWTPQVLELRGEGALCTDNIGAHVHFDENFRTKNFPLGDERAFQLSYDIKKDPHVYCNVDRRKIYVEIDPRWVTTDTALSDFRPAGGRARLSGVGYITQVTAESAIIKPLIMGLSKPSWDLSPF